MSTISAFLRDKTGVYLVAEYEGQLVGHAFLEPYKLQSLRHVADLNIAVDRDWQGKEIGTSRLWCFSLSNLQDLGIEVMRLDFYHQIEYC